LPVPGITITLGPVGMVVHAPNARSASADETRMKEFMVNYPNIQPDGGCGVTRCHPPGHSLT
jgi:hypothetical protein